MWIYNKPRREAMPAEWDPNHPQVLKLGGFAGKDAGGEEEGRVRRRRRHRSGEDDDAQCTS